MIISVLSSEDLESSAATLLQQKRNLVFIQMEIEAFPSDSMPAAGPRGALTKRSAPEVIPKIPVIQTILQLPVQLIKKRGSPGAAQAAQDTRCVVLPVVCWF